MRPYASRLPRALFIAIFGLVCFGAGYIVPHGMQALAQTPNPTPSLFHDNVPGQWLSYGPITVNEASLPMGVTGQHWPCAKGEKQCSVTINFKIGLNSAPAAISCPKSHEYCLTFASSAYNVQVQDHNGMMHPSSGFEKVYAAGLIQFTK